MASRLRQRTAEEGGTGLVSTLFGVTAFLLFMLFAVQVLLGLYTTTVVSSAAIDAAHELAHATDPTDPATQDAVIATARRRLGSFAATGERVRFDLTGTDADEVVMQVHAKKMTLLPRAFGRSLGNTMDRTTRADRTGSMKARRRNDERGQAGGVEAIAFGLLVFVAGTLIVANAWGLIDAKFAASSAAREAAATFTETGESVDVAASAAEQSAGRVLAGAARKGTARVTLSERGYERCAFVTVIVATEVPAVRVPFIGSSAGRVTVRASSTRLIDPYRSGLPGETRC